MATGKIITVIAQVGRTAESRLTAADHVKIVNAAIESLPRLNEATLLNTPWDEMMRTRRKVIQRDLAGNLHDTGDLQPTE